MENEGEHHFSKTTRDIIVGLLAAALLVAIVWFGLDIHSLYRQGAIKQADSRIHRRTVVRPTLAPAQIQSWMTFRYIDFVFRLPANYLAGKLGITDAGFLNMTLTKYADGHKLTIAAFVQQVREAVASYQGGVNP